VVFSHDIFQVDPSGGVLWNGAAENLSAAKAHIRKLAAGEYLILDQNTQQRLRVTIPSAQIVGPLESLNALRNSRD
jgi:hypothetical protein